MWNNAPRHARWWEWLLLIVLLTILAIGILWADEAGAQPIATQEVLRDILADRDSPLASVADTPAAFWRSHRDFDLGGWLAVVWAETSLARDSFAARTHNIGCIRGGSVGRPWRDWRTGTTAGGFNIYADLYMGQRAHIWLIYAPARHSSTSGGRVSYNQLLSRHQWSEFARIYWGGDYPASYVATLRTAHDKIVADAAERGLRW